MLDQDEGAERTEQPTERRREDARKQGQFAYSHELASSLILLTGACAIWWGGVALVQGLRGDLSERLKSLPSEITVSEGGTLITTLFARGLELSGAIVAALFVVGLSISLAQTGFRISTDALGPKWEKLNPVSGWRRIASLEGAARGFFALAKVCVVAAVVWWVLRDRAGQVAALADGTLQHSVASAWDMSVRLIVTTAGVLATVAVLDYAVQWFRNEKALLMTKQELRDEHKEDAGDPQLRGRRRQRARDIAAQRQMIEQVPQATVIITNPTHFAVALRYERGITLAPVVIAKGRDAFALQIALKARRHGIPVLERKPLARALFKTVKVGQEIPQVLFVAVSEVLAYIYRLRGAAA